MSNYTAIIDADTPIHAAAEACNQRSLKATHVPSGRARMFKNKTEFKGRGTKVIGGWLARENTAREKKGIEPFKPEDFLLETVVEQVKDSAIGCEKFEKYLERLLGLRWIKDYRIVMGGEGNYRYDLAQKKPYKGQRGSKPSAIGDIKDYINNQYSDKVIQKDGIEADDVLGYIGWWSHTQKNNSVVLVHIDKDLYQIPCLHYNPQVEQFIPTPERIDYTVAARSFWKQMLCGDGCDNIGGLEALSDDFKKAHNLKVRGCGDKTAEKLVESCADEREMFELIAEAYKGFYGEDKKELFSWRGEKLLWDWKDHMNEQFQLLRVMEKEGVVPTIYDFAESRGYKGVL